MSVRIHKLAKELGVASKDLIDKISAMGVSVKGHMSAIEDDLVEKIKTEFSNKPSTAKDTATDDKLKGHSQDKPLEEVIKNIKEEPKPKIEKKPEIKEQPKVQEVVKPKAPSQEKALESESAPEGNAIEVEFPITVKQLAAKIEKKPNDIMSLLIKKGIFATINQNLDLKTATDICLELGIAIIKNKTLEQELMKEHIAQDDHSTMIHRSPVVTFMGHVDHGKTSLLDYIRNTKVTEKEKGGITQHIGAYTVKLDKGAVTFLDTPGHAAFTAMRARGANATDIVVLVVAADDGVMPQTREAIDHARAAGVPLVVAINKCDLPDIKLENIKMQLNEIGLMPEEWGGKTTMTPVSAKTGQGIDDLLEMLLLEAEILELKANHDIRARGIVIEAKLCPGKGVTTTFLVKNGTLRVGDIVLSGLYYGRIKAMMDYRGKRVMFAPPSTPVEVLGLQGVSNAGDDFFVVKDEKKAKTLSLLRQEEIKQQKIDAHQKITLENFFEHVQEGGSKELHIILKADVQGSLGALQKTLENLNTKDVKIKITHIGVGNISENDIMLAVVTDSVVIGFHVKIDPKADDVAKREGVEVKKYDIIYEAVDDVKAAMEGLLEPIRNDVVQGKAKVQQVFKVTKIGTVAGCIVVKGKIARPHLVRVVRNGEEVYKGKMKSLKRFKDDAKAVSEGMECGIALEGFSAFEENDIIESYLVEETARRLDKK